MLTAPRVFGGILLVLVLLHLPFIRWSEPFYQNDESRHVMTGLFFRDVLADLPLLSIQEYTQDYYLQYPALGLLVWPPFFYMVEGAAMAVLGPSMAVARVLLGLFAAMACLYLFRLALRTHGLFTAAVATLLFGAAPLVYVYSRQVMLEMPALALGLAATFHFVRWLDEDRRRDLFIAAGASAAAALTRFEAGFLVGLFLFLLAARKRLGLLRRREVMLAAALGLFLVLPYYALTAREMGWFHVQQMSEPLFNLSTTFLAPGNFLYYPIKVPEQMGWAVVPFILIGLARGLFPPRRRSAWPYLAIIASVYLTVAPLAALEIRHTIYWIPALALFAAAGVETVATLERRGRLQLPLAAVVVALTAFIAVRPAPFVEGYEEAARRVLAGPASTPVCLFDGGLNGNFIYQMRKLDPGRRWWVLRGDRLLYNVLSVTKAGYKEYTTKEEEVLEAIYRMDPEWIVVEEPRTFTPTPIADLLRRVLREHPERFHLDAEVPLRTNTAKFREVKLVLYRNIHRNPRPTGELEVEVMGIRRNLKASMPR